MNSTLLSNPKWRKKKCNIRLPLSTTHTVTFSAWRSSRIRFIALAVESSNPWLQHESPISSSSDVLCYIIKLILHALSKSKRSKGDTFEIWPQILVLLSFDTLPFAYARLPRIMTFLCNISLPANFCLQVVHTQTYQFILNFSFTYLNILRLIRESLLRSETRCHSLQPWAWKRRESPGREEFEYQRKYYPQQLKIITSVASPFISR